jgi:hypothetical protein
MSLSLFLENPERHDAYNILSKFKDMDTCVFVKEHFNKPHDLDYAIFDSTEILNFSGSIISDSIDNSLQIINSTSRCTLYHLYDPNDKKLIDLMKLSKYNHIVFCCETDEDLSDLRRKIGNVKDVRKFESLEKLIEVINVNKRIRNCQKI